METGTKAGAAELSSTATGMARAPALRSCLPVRNTKTKPLSASSSRTVRVNLHLGQTVRFLARHDGSLREGKMLTMKDTQVVLQDLRERRE